MFTIINFLKGAVTSAKQSVITLKNSLSYFTRTSDEPQSHAASVNKKESSFFSWLVEIIKTAVHSVKEFVLEKVGAEPFEKTLRKRELLTTDYRFCRSQNNEDIPRALLSLTQLHANVLSLFRAGFMSIKNPNTLKVVSEEKGRKKKFLFGEEEKSQVSISNMQGELGQTSATIKNLVIRTALSGRTRNPLIKIAKKSKTIPEKLLNPTAFKNVSHPYDILNSEEYNREAELIIIKLSVVLAKMHAARGIDVSHQVSQADILNELTMSFRNLLKLDENLHSLLAYTEFLTDIQKKPEVNKETEEPILSSNHSLYQWSLYILTTYHKEKLLGSDTTNNNGTGSDIELDLTSIREIRATTALNVGYRRGPHNPGPFIKERFAEIKEFQYNRMLVNIPRNPVEILRTPRNTDFASTTSMPQTVYLPDKTLCIEHGKFYNNRMLYPLVQSLAKGATNLRVNLGPANSLVNQLAYGPRPPVDYQLLPKPKDYAMARTEIPTSRLYSLYRKDYPRSDFEREYIMNNYALISGNMWYIFNKTQAISKDVSEEALQGRGLIGPLWNIRSFFGLALHISRYSVNIKSNEPSAQQCFINACYFNRIITNKYESFRYECFKKIIRQSEQLITTLRENPVDSGYLQNPATGKLDINNLISEISFAILGLEYHLFVANSKMSKIKYTRKNIDLEYFRFLQKYSLFYLDKVFQEEFCGAGKEDAVNTFKELRDDVITSRIRSKIKFTENTIEWQKTQLEKLKAAERLMILNTSEQQTMYLLSDFLSSTPYKTSIKFDDLQNHFFTKAGYKFTSSSLLKRKLDNILSQRSCEDTIRILVEDKQGYQNAIETLEKIVPLNRPKDLTNYFSENVIVNSHSKISVEGLLAQAKQEITSQNNSSESDANATQQSESGANPTQQSEINVIPQQSESASLREIIRLCENSKNTHWYTLGGFLEFIPKCYQNQVFVSMLEQVYKVLTYPGQENFPLNGALYHKYEHKSETIGNFKTLFISYADRLDYSISLENEEKEFYQDQPLLESGDNL